VFGLIEAGLHQALYDGENQRRRDAEHQHSGNLSNFFAALAPEGRIATTNSRTIKDLGPLEAKGASLHVIFMLLSMLRGPGRDRHGRILRILGEMADVGKLRPLLNDSRFTLETAPDAHRRL
jgi:NADPH2:quinone reductase